jgi:NTP pyrophosphatase (non-canonical NTP hydrolase)
MNEQSETSEAKTSSANATVSAWRPMTDPGDIACLGKLLEELGELTAAVSRCLIQGIGECEPVTGKPNVEWLKEELTDVYAMIVLTRKRFDLYDRYSHVRFFSKINHKQTWLKQLDKETRTS